jgi:hypothetical protein
MAAADAKNVENNPMHSSRCVSDQGLMRAGAKALQKPVDPSGKTPA